MSNFKGRTIPTLYLPMSKCAVVKETRHELLYGRGHYTYEWEGDARAPVAVSASFLHHNPALLDALPWKLICVGFDPAYYCYYFVRYNLSGVPAAATVLRARAASLYASVQARIVLTAMVWGLAYVPEGVAPVWRHIGRTHENAR